MWLIYISRAKLMILRGLKIYQVRILAPDGQAEKNYGYLTDCKTKTYRLSITSFPQFDKILIRF